MNRGETMLETHLRLGRQTTKLGLIKLALEMFPEDQLKASYSILDGVFLNLHNSILSVREVNHIATRLKQWVENNSQIEYLYQKDGYYQYRIGDLIIKTLHPAYTDTSKVEPFTIIPFSYGFIIDFGDANIKAGKPVLPPFRLSTAYEKNQLWMRNINIEFVSDINALIKAGESQKVRCIAEALQEKEIAEIADMILAQRRALRVLLISGPSSSGKTSFTQRLSTQLLVNGFKPVTLSLDDYFVNRENTPIDDDGDYDFDAFEALDIPLLHQHLLQLINGETVETPIFDFVSGQRLQKTRTKQVGPSKILVIEGIHALNPNLIPNVNKSLLFKVYVSALGGLNIDLINRLPTTEIRLIRRMVRDDRSRGADPEETLKHWPDVRRNEYKNVFEYQEECDVMFNSSMLYELNALRPLAEQTIAKIKDDGPYADTKKRLLDLLSFFEPMEPAKIPFNSILREFIGGSIYFED